MSKLFALWVALFFIAGCGSLATNFPTEKSPETLPILTVLPVIKIPLELPSDISAAENPWVDLSAEIDSNFRLTNMKYVNSSHPRSDVLRNNAFKSAKYWTYSPNQVNYVEGKRYLLRITNSKNKDDYKAEKPIPIESVWQAKLDRPEIYSVYKNHAASKASSGFFVVQVTIGTDGKIKKGKIIKSELNNVSLESALLGAVEKIRIWPFFSYNPQDIIHTYEFTLLSKSNRNVSQLALKLEHVSFQILLKDMQLQEAKRLCASDFPENSAIYNKKYSDWKMARSFAISSSKEVLDEIAQYDAKKADLFKKMDGFIEGAVAKSYQSKRRVNEPSFCEELVIHLDSVFE